MCFWRLNCKHDKKANITKAEDEKTIFLCLKCGGKLEYREGAFYHVAT